jgi:hypothetical protein
MVAVIVLLDQFIWRPVIAWAEKFKIEQVENTDAPRSWVLTFIQHSRRSRRDSQENSDPGDRKTDASTSPALTQCGKKNAPSPWKAWLTACPRACATHCDRLCSVRVVMISHRPAESRTTGSRHRPGRNFSARESRSGAGRAMDHPRRRGDRPQPAPRAHRAAAGADRRFHSGNGAAAGHPAVAHPSRRRTRHRFHRSCCSWARSGMCCST